LYYIGSASQALLYLAWIFYLFVERYGKITPMDILKGKELYLVAVKLLLRDGDKLLITHDIFDMWDLPGGRIRVDEFHKQLESVIERKVREELGSDVQYKLGQPAVFFRVEREEHALTKHGTYVPSGQMVRIFAIGYEAHYLGGKIKLGEYHDNMEWISVQTFDPKKYFKGGWLVGVQEYLAKVKQ